MTTELEAKRFRQFINSFLEFDKRSGFRMTKERLQEYVFEQFYLFRPKRYD